MPAEAFEEVQELTIELLEATPAENDAAPSYPYPRLALTGRQEQRAFRALVLENRWLRLTVIPDLGGRLISIFDKRTGTEILPEASNPQPVPGGRRGVTLPFGVELYTQGQERLTALGATQWAIEHGAEDEARVWIGEAADGSGLSWHLSYTLAADRPEFIIEAKIFNRTYSYQSYNGAITFHLGAGETTSSESSITHYADDRKGGLWIDTSPSVFDGVRVGSSLTVSRFKDTTRLAPRQLDNFSLRVVPVSGLYSIHGANREAALSLGADFIQVQTSSERLGHKLVVLTEAGATLEAPVDLYPERRLEIPFSDLPNRPVRVALLDPKKAEILQASAQKLAREPHAPNRHPEPLTFAREDSPTKEELRRLTFNIADRHRAYAQIAALAFVDRDYGLAEEMLEQSLAFNAEDHLAWWAKAMASRLKEGPGEERPELLNAHYLAPLDPVLRAEAFLAQEQEMGKDKNPLLTPFEEFPDCFVEVASLLVDLGVWDQATRFIDEALRHTDLPMLRYLQAFCFLKASRMHVEAGEYVAAAARLGFIPPFPWRNIEWMAVATLRARFPQDALLEKYSNLNAGPVPGQSVTETRVGWPTGEVVERG